MREKIVMLGLAASLWLPAPAAIADETTQRAAAEAYIEATGGFAAQIDATIATLATRLPADRQERFVRFMHETLDPAELEAVAVEGMVKHFTEEELQALVDFYGSEPGRSIAAKFPVFFADTMREMATLINERASEFEP